MSIIPVMPHVLTERELATLRLLASGVPQKRLMKEMKVSGDTLQSLKGHIYRKLKIRGQVQIIHYALYYYLVPNLFDPPLRHAPPRHD